MSEASAADGAATPSSPPESTNGDLERPNDDRQDLPTALRGLADRIDLLVAHGDESNRISQERERIVDRLHADVQSLRQGELQQAVAPLLRDLIKLFDDLDREAARSTAAGAERAAVAVTVAGYRDDVGDILFRYGVERYDAPEGTPFDPKEHRAVTIVETPVPEQDGRLARIARSGFRNGARIVRHLEAHVFRHVTTPNTPTPPTGTE